jgi:hypothetical protein
LDAKLSFDGRIFPQWVHWPAFFTAVWNLAQMRFY